MKKILLAAFTISLIVTISLFTIFSNPCGGGCGGEKVFSFLYPFGKKIKRNPQVICATVCLRAPNIYFYLLADITFFLGFLTSIILLKDKIKRVKKL